MITETIYEHLKDIYNSKVGPLVSPAIEIDPSLTVSRVIHDITNNDVYDVFCMDGDTVLTTNVRALLAGKDIADMKISPFLSTIRFLTRNDLIQKAANIIAHYRVRAVPVVENNKIIGCVTAKSILELLSKKDNKWIQANLILTPNPITIK
ncbi:MAG: CBS domain-containing protein [Nitrosopumilaceae archaeon]